MLSATSAATEGLYLIKNRPLAVAVWGLVIFAATAVAIGLIAATVGFAAFSNFSALAGPLQAGEEPDRAAVLRALAEVMTVGAIGGLVYLLVDAVLVTAVKRAVLRPEDDRAFYLRVGMDELRTFAVRLVRALIMMALWVAVVVVTVVLGRAVHPAVGVLFCFAAIPGLVYVWVKLSLAVSQSFAERRFALFGSWRLTAGHFWPVLGAYLLAIVFYLIASFVISTIAGVAGGNALLAEMMKDPENVDPATLGPAFVKFLLINMVAGLITKVFELPVLGAPPAVAYRDLSADAAD
jgi:hypothetical protein